MDYRKRKYYLVTLESYGYRERIKILKRIAPTSKISPPYNHIMRGNIDGSNYDGDHRNITGMSYVEFMISCKIEDSKLLEFQLREQKKQYGYGCNFVELTKEMCGQ